MIATLKIIAPVILYTISCLLIFAALTGKTEWILMFITGLLPLRNVIEKLQDYPFGGDLLDIMIIFAMISVFIRAASKKNKEEKVKFTAIHWISIAIIGYTFLSVINGSLYLNEALIFSIQDKRIQSWKNFCTMPILFFITFSTVKDKKLVWRIITIMCMTMVLMDYYTGQQVLWYRNIESRVKINGTFVYLGPNEVAAFYNQYTILLMGLFFYMKKSFKKLGLMFLIFVNLYVVVFLFSRAAYLGLAVGLFFLFALKKRILLIPLILAAISWQVVLPEKVIQRIEMTTGDYNELDKSSELRLEAWQLGFDLFSENPIFGVGYGVYRSSGFLLGDTHNIYVKILAEQGLIGISIFLLLLFCLFIKGIRLYQYGDDDLSKGLGLGFAIAILVLSVNNIFGDRWTYMEISSYLWIIAALVCKLLVMPAENESSKPKTKNKSKVNGIHGKFAV